MWRERQAGVTASEKRGARFRVLPGPVRGCACGELWASCSARKRCGTGINGQTCVSEGVLGCWCGESCQGQCDASVIVMAWARVAVMGLFGSVWETPGAGDKKSEKTISRSVVMDTRSRNERSQEGLEGGA